MIRGLTGFSFGSVEYLLKSLGISPYGFNVTSKVVDEEQSKRYNQGEFEFGVPSPLFLPLATAAVLNLVSFPIGNHTSSQSKKPWRSVCADFLNWFCSSKLLSTIWSHVEDWWRQNACKYHIDLHCSCMGSLFGILHGIFLTLPVFLQLFWCIMGLFF